MRKLRLSDDAGNSLKKYKNGRSLYRMIMDMIKNTGWVLKALVILVICGFVRADAAFKAAGSDSTFMVVRALAEAFERKAGIGIELSGGGSSHGAKACLAQEVQMGFLSRKLKESEIQKGLYGTEYAIDGVAVVVSPRNPIDSLTVEELQGIYSGDAGWPDGRSVVLFNRNESSGTREVFQKIVMNDGAFSSEAKILHNQLMMRKISKIPTAIGYTSASDISATVKVLNINEVAPTSKHLLDGSYPITRTLTFVFLSEENPEVKQFLEFVLSEEGSTIIKQTGFLPLN